MQAFMLKPGRCRYVQIAHAVSTDINLAARGCVKLKLACFLMSKIPHYTSCEYTNLPVIPLGIDSSPVVCAYVFLENVLYLCVGILYASMGLYGSEYASMGVSMLGE